MTKYDVRFLFFFYSEDILKCGLILLSFFPIYPGCTQLCESMIWSLFQYSSMLCGAENRNERCGVIECDASSVLTDSHALDVSPAGMFFRLMNYKLEGENDSDSQNDSATEWTKALRPLPVTFEINTFD